MYKIEVHQRVNQLISLYRICGMWRHEDETVLRKMWWTFTYLIFFMYFLISMALAGFLGDDKNESIFLVGASVSGGIVLVKLVYIHWKKDEILAFLNDICIHSVTDPDEFTKINKRADKFMKFGSCFILLIFVEILLIICLPLLSNEKILPFNIAFPLDWKNSEISYWISYTFVIISVIVAATTVMFSIVIWCLMMNCSIKYQILGNQFRNMGSIKITKPTDKTRKIKEMEKQGLFSNELIGLIKVHQNIRETIDRFKSCFSDLFLAQYATSGICICGGVYVLAFSPYEDLIQSGIHAAFLLYNIFDIFMIMHFGNEIKLSSDRLSYCLFESNWIDQSESCKKCIIVLSEVVKQPHQLIVGKLYPLDLETFIAILNLAYSMFNILRNFN